MVQWQDYHGFHLNWEVATTEEIYRPSYSFENHVSSD